MWELIQIISQLGIKDSHAVHTLTVALQAKFGRNRWNNGVWGFQLLLSKAKTPCDMESPRDSLWSLLPKVCWTTPMAFLGKLRLLLGRRKRTSANVNLCSRPPRVPQPAEPLVPGALCSLGSISSPFWASQETPVDIHVMHAELHQHHCPELFSSGNHQHSGNG